VREAKGFVIGGYTQSSKGLPDFGSLVLGVYGKGKLFYEALVGTGFTFKQRSDLKKQLDKLSRQTSPFVFVPKGPDLRETKLIEIFIMKNSCWRKHQQREPYSHLRKKELTFATLALLVAAYYNVAKARLLPA